MTLSPSLREAVLERDGHLCQICREAPATQVDHIWPRSHGGPDRLDNLQASCRPCNHAKWTHVDWSSATPEQIKWATAARLARYERQRMWHNPEDDWPPADWDDLNPEQRLQLVARRAAPLLLALVRDYEEQAAS